MATIGRGVWLLALVLCCVERTIGTNTVRVKAELCRGMSCKPWQQCVADGNGQAEPYCGCETKCAPSKNQNRDVCASDGETYASKCEMRKSSCILEIRLRMVSKGRCLTDPCLSVDCGLGKICIPDPAEPSEPKCICNYHCPLTQADYVCASDNQTYQTPCHLHKAACEGQAAISIVHQGLCSLSPGLGGMSVLPHDPTPLPGHATEFSCSMCSQHTYCDQENAACVCARCDHVTRSPVCGSDHKTHDSACHLYRAACLNKRGTTVVYTGSCKDPIHELPLPCRGVQCQYGSICKPKDGKGVCVCPTFCPNYEDTVCASNGRTFHNRCFLKRAECLEHTTLTVRADGPCPTTQPILATTPAKTPDACENVTCPRRQQCMVRDGHSFCACFTSCSTEQTLVCGSDGTDYLNPCRLRSMSCIRNISLTIKHHGSCRPTSPCDRLKCPRYGRCVVENGAGRCDCSRNCSSVNSTVCGSDEKLYVNLCALKKLACQSGENITPISKGQCLLLQRNRVRPTAQGNQDPCATMVCRFHGRCVVNPTTGLATCNCERNCSSERQPVCGLNGGLHIYNNLCIMEKVACQLSEDIRAVEMARCVPHTVAPTRAATAAATVVAATAAATVVAATTSTPTPEMVKSPTEEAGCHACTEQMSLLESFPRACHADIVVNGKLNSTSANVAGGYVEYAFTVQKYITAPKVNGQTLSEKKLKVRMRSSCLCSSPPSSLVLAGTLVLDASSGSLQHIEVDHNTVGVLAPYSKKPWKFFRGMYRYGRELQKMICRKVTR